LATLLSVRQRFTKNKNLFLARQRFNFDKTIIKVYTLHYKMLWTRAMVKIVKYLIMLFLITPFAGCSPTREASTKDRAGIMLLKPEEFTRNKPYKPSKLKQKIHKKAKKSLLKGSYKTK